MVRLIVQIAAPARPHVSGLIQGPATRMVQRSRRLNGQDASREAGIFRSGSVLKGKSSTRPKIRNMNEPAGPMNSVTQKKLLPVSDCSAVQSRRYAVASAFRIA